MNNIEEQPTKTCKGGIYFKKKCIYIENHEVPGCEVCVGKSVINMGGDDVLICNIDKYNKASELKKRRSDGIRKYWSEKKLSKELKI